MSAVHEMLRRLLNVSVFVFRPSKWGRLTALEIDGRPPIQTVHKYFLFHELIFKSVLYWMFVCTCVFQNSLWFNFEIYFRPDAPNLSSFPYPVFSICHVCLLAHLWILLNVWMHVQNKSLFFHVIFKMFVDTRRKNVMFVVFCGVVSNHISCK